MKAAGEAGSDVGFTPMSASKSAGGSKPAISAIRENEPNEFLPEKSPADPPADPAGKPLALDLSKVPLADDDVKSPLDKFTAALESFRATGTFKPAVKDVAKPAEGVENGGERKGSIGLACRGRKTVR